MKSIFTGALVAMVTLRRSGVLHAQLRVAAQVQSKMSPIVAVAVQSLCAPVHLQGHTHGVRPLCILIRACDTDRSLKKQEPRQVVPSTSLGLQIKSAA